MAGIVIVSLLAAAMIFDTPLSIGPDLPECEHQPGTSCFNRLALNPADDWSDYSFVALGHIRSGPRERISPNQLLRNNVQRLFTDDPRFVLSLGDLYAYINDRSLKEMSTWVNAYIPVPFFNAVGNHDIKASALGIGGLVLIGRRGGVAKYASKLGPLYFDFTVGSELFVFLHIGLGSAVSAEQLRYLRSQIQRALSDPVIINVFILNHMVIWSYNNPIMEPVFRYRHPKGPRGESSFFLDEIRPLLLPLARKKRVFLLAGDIGGSRNYLQTFYMKDEHFTYIATGMGNTDRDSFVTFTVKDGVVTMKNTNLVTGVESPLTDYGVEYWERFYREHPDRAAKVDRFRDDNPM